MEFEVGRVVVSKSGRDKGYFLVVTDVADGFIFVCDGKERPLERPKKKNPIHLALTKYTLTDDETATNRALRRALNSIQNHGEGGKTVCRNKI